jgi:hypothetical protein
LVTTSNYTVTQLTASAIKVTNLFVTTVTSSIVYASGSNKFGDEISDRHEFTGSVSVTGSMYVDHSVTAHELIINTGGSVPASIITLETTSISSETVVDSFSDGDGYAAKWFVNVRNGTNHRTSEVVAAWENIGDIVAFTETSTLDTGDTNPLVLRVDISSNNVRLVATPASGTWAVRATRLLM